MPDTASTPAALFLGFSREKLFYQEGPRLRACVESLTDEQIWWRPNASSNSIGNLLLHLSGNVRQWLVTSFNRDTDERDRPAEFAAQGKIPGAALLQTLDATLAEAAQVLDRLTEADLIAPYEIQGFHGTGLTAIYHVVEHFSLHYGQVAYITKMLRDQDLGFYKELNQSGHRPHSATIAQP